MSSIKDVLITILQKIASHAISSGLFFALQDQRQEAKFSVYALSTASNLNQRYQVSV